MYVVDECDALPNGVCEGEFFTKVVVRGNRFHCEKYSRVLEEKPLLLVSVTEARLSLWSLF